MIRVDKTTWETFVWPEWVPQEIRTEVERFWSKDNGRTPLQWLENAIDNYAPANSSIASLKRIKRGVRVALTDDHYELCTGRYVHCWNNIGRLVHADGTFSYVSLGDPDDKIERYAQW